VATTVPTACATTTTQLQRMSPVYTLTELNPVDHFTILVLLVSRLIVQAFIAIMFILMMLFLKFQV